MRSKESGGAFGRFVRRVTTRYAAGVAACAIATVVPLASAANLRMQAGANVTAGDIYCNIVRGARIQDYFASGQTFSIPVLWLCSLLVVSLGAVCLLMPPQNDIERTRLLASRSRTSYWAHRIAAVTGYAAFQLIWRLVCCMAIALVLGGSPNLGLLSADAEGLFSMEGPVAWGMGCLVRSCCLEFAVMLVISLVAGGIAVIVSAPVGVAALAGYVTVSVFTGLPVLVPNLLMLHRYVEYEAAGAPLLWLAAGLLPLGAVFGLLFTNLRTVDFLH